MQSASKDGRESKKMRKFILRWGCADPQTLERRGARLEKKNGIRDQRSDEGWGAMGDERGRGGGGAAEGPPLFFDKKLVR